MLPLACCPRCALPTPGGAVCGHCLKREPAFDQARAVYRYEFPVDVMIQRLKYAGQTALAAFLVERLAPRLTDRPPPDLILPMPLHPQRLRERGFNQAAVLAGHLARRTGARLVLDLLQRRRDTPPQVGLLPDARRRNIKGAFACRDDLSGLRVALVDDVMTTGASLEELAKVVRRAGAVEVSAWVVARAVKS